MGIELLERIKNEEGSTIAYNVSINGGTPERRDLKSLIDFKDLVFNAVLINNSDFKAKKGYHIKTSVEYNKLISVDKTLKKLKLGIFNIDYYGKGFESICRKIRHYAQLGKVTIDRREHKYSDNLQLLQAIDSTGIDTNLFITSMLQCIQPYSLLHFQKGKEKYHDNKDIWLYDLGYRVKLVLKFEVINSVELLIVSFHESMLGDKYNTSHYDFSKKPCAVIINNAINRDDIYYVSYTMQRGFIREYNIQSQTKFVKNDLALVHFSDFNYVFMNKLNSEYTRLCNIYNENIGYDIIDINAKISFMSYGFEVINNISMLIDLYSMSNNKETYLNIIDVTNNLLAELNDSDLECLRNTIKAKYGIGYDNKVFKLVTGL